MTTGRINQVTVPRSLEPAPASNLAQLPEQPTGRPRNRPGTTILPIQSVQEVAGPPGSRIQVICPTSHRCHPRARTRRSRHLLPPPCKERPRFRNARSHFPHAASTPRPRGQHYGTTIRLGTIFPTRPTLHRQCFGRPVKVQGGHGARNLAGTGTRSQLPGQCDLLLSGK